MAVLLDGLKLANKINSETKETIAKLDTKPHLVAIQVGDVSESNLYISHKAKKAKELGISFSHIKFDENITTKELLVEINKLNDDKSVDGIMVQLPLPNHIYVNVIYKSIIPEKDVDGFNPLNKGLLDINQANLIPPTAKGVMKLLKEYKIDLKGKIVTVIGLGEIAGKPLTKLFINNKSTVIMCDKNTKDIYQFIKISDIVVAAVGYKHLITEKHIKKDVVIINIGLTKQENTIYGDVTFDSMLDKASFITPITGGTGPMTVAMLLKNTLICYKMKDNK